MRSPSAAVLRAVGLLPAWDLAGSLVELLVATPWEAGSPTRRSWEPQSVLLLVHCWGGQLADDSSLLAASSLIACEGRGTKNRVPWSDDI